MVERSGSNSTMKKEELVSSKGRRDESRSWSSSPLEKQRPSSFREDGAVVGVEMLAVDSGTLNVVGWMGVAGELAKTTKKERGELRGEERRKGERES